MDDGQTRKNRPRGSHQWECEPKSTLVEKMGFYQAQLCVEMNMHGCVEKINMHVSENQMNGDADKTTASRGGRQVQK